MQMEDQAKIESMNWPVILNQTLQGSDWDKLLRVRALRMKIRGMLCLVTLKVVCSLTPLPHQRLQH